MKTPILFLATTLLVASAFGAEREIRCEFDKNSSVPFVKLELSYPVTGAIGEIRIQRAGEYRLGQPQYLGASHVANGEETFYWAESVQTSEDSVDHLSLAKTKDGQWLLRTDRATRVGSTDCIPQDDESCVKHDRISEIPASCSDSFDLRVPGKTETAEERCQRDPYHCQD